MKEERIFLPSSFLLHPFFLSSPPGRGESALQVLESLPKLPLILEAVDELRPVRLVQGQHEVSRLPIPARLYPQVLTAAFEEPDHRLNCRPGRQCAVARRFPLQDSGVQGYNL